MIKVLTDVVASSTAMLPVAYAVITSAQGLSRAGDDMAVLTIGSDGMICHCNKAAGILLNCIPSQVVWQSISSVLPQLKNVALIIKDGVNPNLRFLSRIGHPFEVVALNGRRFASKLYFNEVEDFGRHCLRLIIRPMEMEAA